MGPGGQGRMGLGQPDPVADDLKQMPPAEAIQKPEVQHPIFDARLENWAQDGEQG